MDEWRCTISKNHPEPWLHYDFSSAILNWDYKETWEQNCFGAKVTTGNLSSVGSVKVRKWKILAATQARKISYMYVIYWQQKGQNTQPIFSKSSSTTSQDEEMMSLRDTSYLDNFKHPYPAMIFGELRCGVMFVVCCTKRISRYFSRWSAGTFIVDF